ncbi:MAG: methyltransferase domain-containing protein [Candidatus Omnitrophota bacterium]
MDKKNREELLRDSKLREHFFANEVIAFCRRKMEFILQNLKPGIILDAGVGSGYISAEIKKSNSKVFSLDSEFAAIQECQLLMDLRQIRFQLFIARLPDLPFKDSNFDSIVCTDVIEHIPDLEKAFYCFHRILKPEGRLILSLPNGYGFDTIAGLYSKRNNSVNKRLKELGIDINQKYSKSTLRHIHKFTPRSMKKYLEKSRFDILKFENTAFLSQYISAFFSGILGYEREFSSRIENIDIRIAKHLPLLLGSHWLISCKKI